MNKKILIILILSVFVIQRVSALEYNNTDSGFKALIEDEAELLTDAEEKSLLEDMIPLTKYGNIMFNSTTNAQYPTSRYAKEKYHELFSNKSGTSFTIDMKNREIYIFSDGFNYRIISDRKAYVITDNIYKYATNKEYYTCSKEAFKEIYTLLSGNRIIEPMVYITNYLLSLLIAFIITFIFVIIYSRNKLPSYDDILKNCIINFTSLVPVVRKVGTHKVYNPSSDSSSSGFSGSSGGGGGGGGGHSGGGGGGGSSSGGGGGHRF